MLNDSSKNESETQQQLINKLVEHIDKLLSSPAEPPLPPELADNDRIRQLHDKFVILRRHMTTIFKGDLSQDISTRGYLAGLLKGHLANLRHLTWQVEQVAQGDFTQRIDFMGEFSKAFNNMTLQLDTNLRSLKATEEALTRLTTSLQHEVEMRTIAVNALRQSEARFKYLADHDSLTGALNRRSFLAIAEGGVKAAFANKSACCIALLDIDFFKKVNDTYGHQNGDLALKHIVALSNDNLRQSDSMGRYGGEEFIFFFSDANIEQGVNAAERIRGAIAEAPVQFASGPVPLTVSLGVSAVLPEWKGERDLDFLQKVIAMADTALYQAKDCGRNRVCAAPVLHPDLVEGEETLLAEEC